MCADAATHTERRRERKSGSCRWKRERKRKNERKDVRRHRTEGERKAAAPAHHVRKEGREDVREGDARETAASESLDSWLEFGVCVSRSVGMQA